MEKKTKELEMGLDAQKSFAQMYEDRKMNERIGGQMMKLDIVIVQETRNKNWNKGAPIPVLNKGQKLQSRPYFHTNDPDPRQNAIGLRISAAKDPRK